MNDVLSFFEYLAGAEAAAHQGLLVDVLTGKHDLEAGPMDPSDLEPLLNLWRRGQRKDELHAAFVGAVTHPNPNVRAGAVMFCQLLGMASGPQGATASLGPSKPRCEQTQVPASPGPSKPGCQQAQMRARLGASKPRCAQAV